MSKTIHMVNLPKATGSNDFSNWYTTLENIGFTIDTTNKKAYWKDSDAFLTISNNYMKLGNEQNNPIDNVSYYSVVSYDSKFYYIKFNDKSIVFGFVRANSASMGFFSGYIIEPNTGATRWTAIANTYWANTEASKIYRPYYTSIRAATFASSVLLAPFRVITNYDINVKNIYIVIYGPNITNEIRLAHIGDKQYIVSFAGDSTYAPFAIDVDAIWDDEDY